MGTPLDLTPAKSVSIAVAILLLSSTLPAQDAIQSQLLVEHNQYRAAANKPPLVMDAQLTLAAQEKSALIARIQILDHHANGGYTAAATRHGYKWSLVSENLGMGYADARAACLGWRNSSGHYASMVGNYRDVGFGYTRDVSGRIWWVAIFGNRHGAAPSPPLPVPAAPPMPEVSLPPSQVTTQTFTWKPRFKITFRR